MIIKYKSLINNKYNLWKILKYSVNIENKNIFKFLKSNLNSSLINTTYKLQEINNLNNINFKSLCKYV